MTNTVIYISITQGKETLTLDGNLYLFQELLATLQKMPQEVSPICHPFVSIANIAGPKQEGSHVTT